MIDSEEIITADENALSVFNKIFEATYDMNNDRKVIQAENEMYNIMREYKDTSNGMLE